MRRPSKPALLGALAAAACLATPAAASASSPLDEYQQTGHITPCKYSTGQLQGDVPNDVAQYAPEYQSQLQAAARDRANGCGGGSTAAAGGQSQGSGGAVGALGAGGGSGSGGGGGNPPPPRPPRAPAAKPVGPRLEIPRSVSPSSAGVGTTPGPVLALAVLIVAALLGVALAFVARLLGWGVGWTAPGRHALREAGMRAGTAVTGIVDWARARGTSGA